MAKSSANNSILVIDSISDNLGYLLDTNKKLHLVRFGEQDSLLKKVKIANLRVASFLPLSGRNVNNEAYKTIYHPMQIIKTEEEPEEFIISKLYNEYADKMEGTQDNNYMVKFIPTASISPNHIDYDVLVYFDDDIKDKFGVCADELTYIDEIYPEPFLYKALYVKSVLKPVGTDVFIYLDTDKVTITMYRAGEYLSYYESAQLKLNGVRLSYNRETNENMGDAFFAERLVNDGLKFTYDSIAQSGRTFEDLFDPYFNGHVSLFAMIDKLCKRKGVTNVGNIIVHSCFGTIKGFSERLQRNYRDTQVINFKNLELNLTINNLNEFYHDRDKKAISNLNNNKISTQADSVMSGEEVSKFDLNINMYTLLSLLWLQSEAVMDDFVDANVTLFARPPKFLKRRSGQIISIAVLSFLLAWVFPISSMLFNSYMDKQIQANNAETKERSGIITSSKNRIAAEERKRNEANNQLTQSQNSLRFEQDLINQIDDKKNGYLIKSKCLSNLAVSLHENKITVKQLDYREDGGVKSVHMNVHAFDDDITALVKELIEQGYDVENKLIKRLDNKLKRHEADIIIKIKEGSCR